MGSGISPRARRRESRNFDQIDDDVGLPTAIGFADSCRAFCRHPGPRCAMEIVRRSLYLWQNGLKQLETPGEEADEEQCTENPDQPRWAAAGTAGLRGGSLSPSARGSER